MDRGRGDSCFLPRKRQMMEREGGKRQTESGRHEKEARLAVISSESVKTLPSIGLKTDLVRAPVLAERLVL